MLSQRDQDIIRVLKRRLANLAGDRLQDLIIYGSRVWGGADLDSDLDVAVLVRDWTPELEASLLEGAYQVMWDYDFMPLISIKVFDADSFDSHQKKGFSFYRKVALEGLSI